MGGSPLLGSLTASANLLVGRFITREGPPLRERDASPLGCSHDGAAARALCGHDLRRDVGAGRPHRRGEPRPGLPRRGRAARDAQGRRERHRRGRQPVPARPGHRAAARSDRRAAQAPLRHRIRPRHRGAGDRRRDRGDRLGDPRARRTGLRSAVDRAVLRLVLPRHRDGRLPAARGAVGARRPRLRDRRRRTPRSGHAKDQGADRQLAAQPDRHGGLRRRTESARPNSPSTPTCW